MSRKYEIAFLIREGETVDPTVKRIKDYFKKSELELDKEDTFGVRELAYEIIRDRERFHKAYYYFAKVSGKPEAIPVFEAAIKYDQDVIRHLVNRED